MNDHLREAREHLEAARAALEAMRPEIEAAALVDHTTKWIYKLSLLRTSDALVALSNLAGRVKRVVVDASVSDGRQHGDGGRAAGRPAADDQTVGRRCALCTRPLDTLDEGAGLCYACASDLDDLDRLEGGE